MPKWVSLLMYVWMYGFSDGLTDGLVDIWLGELMDGWMNALVQGVYESMDILMY